MRFPRWRFVAPVLMLSVLVPESAAAGMWPNEVDGIERGIQSEDVSERRAAAKELSRIPEQSAQRLLTKALLDDDTEVRVAAAEAAVRLRFDAAVPMLVHWLSEREARLRLVAAKVLSSFPSNHESVQALSRALSDSDIEVRVAVARALGKSRDPHAAMSLLGHLDEANLKVQLAVLEALTRLRDPRSVIPLVGKVSDSRPPVREAVARSLGVFGGERVSSALVLLLRDASDAVRLAAVSSLGRIGASDALDALVHVLENDTSLDVRIAVVNALATTSDEQAARILIELLDSERAEIATEAKVALGRMGDTAAEVLLGCLSGQPSRRRADACAYALARTPHPNAGSALSDAWRRRVVSADAALQAFAVLGDDDALPIVLESLLGTDPWVRSRAVAAARALLDPNQPDGRAVEPLLEATREAAGRKEEQLALVELLGRTGSERVANELAVFARSSRLRLRLAAIHSLGLARAASQQDLLLEALGDDEPSVRREAALALRRASNSEAVAPLLARLERAAERDAPWVALALSGPLSKTKQAGHVELVERRLRTTSGAVRDALIEALGRAPEPLAGPALQRVAKHEGPMSRAKIAEVLAAFPKHRELLFALSEDVRAPTRANAFWSLGFVGDASDLPRVERGLSDPDARVAANAAASWGRIVKRVSHRDASVMCEALSHPRAAVRSNALAALRLAGLRCKERDRQLIDDSVHLVRLSAARLLTAVSKDALDEGALARCFDEERDGRVALACKGPAKALPPQSEHPVTVFVFAPGDSEPSPGAPFVLELADGTFRHGVSDRRGAVLEAAPPDGELRLEVPLLGPDTVR